MTTKAARIRQLLDAGMCNTMIAELVGCREEYVRTVQQRRNPVRRRQDSARNRAAIRTGNKDVASRSARLHYREARKAGKTVDEARLLANAARNKLLFVTCDRDAASAAYRAAKRGTANA